MSAMKRKLVNEDIIKVKKLLSELRISGEQVIFNLNEYTVETPGGLHGEDGTVPVEELATQSEEEVIAGIIAKSEIPEQTALRYLDSFLPYFETEQDKILFSTYNIKLLQVIDQLFSRGLAPEEVHEILAEGDKVFSSMSEPSKEIAREYFESPELDMEFQDEDYENRETGWGGKAAKGGLIALAVLILIAIGSYQLGFLRSLGIYPGSEEISEEALNGRERPVEEREEEAGEEDNGGETTEPYVPALMPEEITVEVLNGSGAPGVAGKFAEELQELGYQVVEVDNADSFDYSRSQVINRLEGDEAWEVLGKIPQAEFLSEIYEEGDAMITVILGSDYS